MSTASTANPYGLTPDQVDYELAHRDETRAPTIMAAVGIFTALATLSVFLRIWVRSRNKQGFKADDHTIFVACVGIYRAGFDHWTSLLI